MKNFQKIALAIMLVLVSGVVLMACGPDEVGKNLTVENYNAIVTTETATGEEVASTFEFVKEKLGTPTGEKKELTDGEGVIEWASKKGDKKITVTFLESKATTKTQKNILED